jgi:hypothetical protein
MSFVAQHVMQGGGLQVVPLADHANLDSSPLLLRHSDAILAARDQRAMTLHSQPYALLVKLDPIRAAPVRHRALFALLNVTPTATVQSRAPYALLIRILRGQIVSLKIVHPTNSIHRRLSNVKHVLWAAPEVDNRASSVVSI